MVKNTIAIAFVLSFIYQAKISAWENKKTHPALTQKVSDINNLVNSYLQTQLGMSQGLQTQVTWNFPMDVEERLRRGEAQPDLTTRTLLGWMKAGSTIEDEDGRQWPIGPRHHFYDPIRNSGLNDQNDHPEWRLYASSWSGFDFTGTSSLIWAIQGIAQKEPTVNEQTWNYARQGFYLGLTSNSPAYREACLAIAFVDLGQVLHLLEDTGVPAHVRNDFLFGHYRSIKDYGNPLESWAEDQVKANNNNIPTAWLTGWTPQLKVFDKISKYWDTGLYTGTYIGLPSSNWGLAEQTNYQFLSTSTVFGCTGTLYQFPQPAESNTIIITESYKRYFQGYGVQHLARETYSYYMAVGYYGPVVAAVAKKTITPDDDNNVYNDYVRVTIPRTIDYATGLLNYFFRGKLSVDANCTCSECDPTELYITNQSVNTNVNQTLKGGSYELYWDDNVGNRTPVSELTVYDSNDPNRTVLWGDSTTLAKGNSVRARFNKPSSPNLSKYILVYCGSISANPSDPDVNDSNALAVCTFDPPGPPRPDITNITPDMGCPGSVLFIEGSGFSNTPSHNTVLFEEANSVHSDVYGIVQEADSNGRWLKVELPVFDASTVDYYWANTTVTADGNTSDPYTLFRLTNYIWCDVFVWDAGEGIVVDDTFDVYLNGEYWFTSYSPPEDPATGTFGFWYEDGYVYLDIYLYDSFGENGGTLGVIVEPYVTRVIAYRWDSISELEEFLYDQDYSGIFYDQFGSDVLWVEGDGVEMDVYATLTYTGTMGLTETAPITTFDSQSNLGGSSERQRQFDAVRVAKTKQISDIPRKRAGKLPDHRTIRTRDKTINRQRAH